MGGKAPFVVIRRQGILGLGMAKIEFDAVFHTIIRCKLPDDFLRNQKVSSIPNVIPFSICENTCNYITSAKLNHNFLKISFYSLYLEL